MASRYDITPPTILGARPVTALSDAELMLVGITDPNFGKFAAELRKRGLMGAWEKKNTSPNFTFASVLKDAVVFYGAAVGGAMLAGGAISAGATATTPAAAGAATAATTSTVAASAATTTATAATTGGIVNTTLGTTLSGWMADAAALGVSAQGLQQTFAAPPKAAPVAAETPNSVAGGITTQQALIGVGGLVLAIILIRVVI